MALFQALLKDLGYADVELFSDFISGFPIIGRSSNTGIWSEMDRPPTSDARTLMATAKWAQHAVKGQTTSHDPVVDAKVWESTLQEASPEKGWLIGPLSSSEVASRLGALWIPARRFGVDQGKKVRNVDDCSKYGTNAAYHATEKMTLGGVGEVINIV